MTQMSIKPGEIRTAPTLDGGTATIMHTAGGSFTQVQVRDANGRLVYNRNHMFEFDALRSFAEWTG